ncbi:MAG: hypothetical protein Q9P01_06835 [Anaerolineae bacterium]|nr:hypothetical protein [Anaerolineae bacterium]
MSTEAGYEKLTELLPFKIDAENSSDFFYQINRRRNSNTISNLELNRLSKWSVLKLQTALIRTDIAANQLITLPEAYACRLELDINTIQNFEGELDQDKLSDLFYELINLGKEIATKGDIS